MSQKTDDELMSEIAKGKKMSFTILFDRHSAPALGYATRLMGDTERAEDLLQETWMKVIKLSQSYQGSGHFRAWLFTLLRNSCLNELRKKQGLELSEEQHESETDSPEELLSEKEKMESLQVDLAELPVNQRTALLMWAVEDMNYEEIGRHLSVNMPAVKSLIFRARQTLKKRRGA